MKSDLYFKHDVYALENSEKLRYVCSEYPVWGDAIFWRTITIMYRKNGEPCIFKILASDVAHELYTDDREKVTEILNVMIEVGLFEKTEDGKIFNERVQKECQKQSDFREKQRERINKRWQNNAENIPTEYQNNTSGIPTEYQRYNHGNTNKQEQEQDNNFNLVSKEPRFVEKQVFHAEENAESEGNLFGENEKIPSHREQVPYKEIMTYWNEKVHGILPQVEKLTEGRKSHIRQRLAEYGERVYRAIDKCIESDFLSGRSKEWQCDFDWVFLPSHMVRILEGKYDNRTVEEVHPRHKDYSDIGKQNADDFSWEC